MNTYQEKRGQSNKWRFSISSSEQKSSFLWIPTTIERGLRQENINVRMGADKKGNEKVTLCAWKSTSTAACILKSRAGGGNSDSRRLFLSTMLQTYLHTKGTTSRRIKLNFTGRRWCFSLDDDPLTTQMKAYPIIIIEKNNAEHDVERSWFAMYKPKQGDDTSPLSSWTQNCFPCRNSSIPMHCDVPPKVKFVRLQQQRGVNPTGTIGTKVLVGLCRRKPVRQKKPMKDHTYGARRNAARKVASTYTYRLLVGRTSWRPSRTQAVKECASLNAETTKRAYHH